MMQKLCKESMQEYAKVSGGKVKVCQSMQEYARASYQHAKVSQCMQKCAKVNESI